LFSYDKTNDIARFDAAAGVFLEGTYTIEVANTGGQAIKDIAGNTIRPNEATGKTMFTISLTQAVAAGSWQNPNNPLDVNNDGAVVGLDALIVINGINNLGNGSPVLPTPAPTPPPFYYDVNGDGILSPLDALIIINFLNNPQPQALVASAMTEVGGGATDSLSFSLAVSGTPRGTLVADSSVKPQVIAYTDQSSESTQGPALALAAEALEEAVTADAWSVDHDQLDDALADIADELHAALVGPADDLWS
jgi:hypothetical protein